MDWPEWIFDYPEDISKETTKGDFDWVRAKKGGLNAALSVVYISPKYGVEEGRMMVDTLIELINFYTKSYPNKFKFILNRLPIYSLKSFLLP